MCRKWIVSVVTLLVCGFVYADSATVAKQFERSSQSALLDQVNIVVAGNGRMKKYHPSLIKKTGGRYELFFATARRKYDRKFRPQSRRKTVQEHSFKICYQLGDCVGLKKLPYAIDAKNYRYKVYLAPDFFDKVPAKRP